MDSDSRGVMQEAVKQEAARQTEPAEDPLLADLAGRSARGGVLMVVSEAGQTALGFISTLVFARLLFPRDFGYIAMVASVMGIVSTIRDFGLPIATSQQRRISSAQLTRLFGFNLKLTALMAVFLAVLAPVISWFYDEPRLTPITLVLTAGIVAASLGTVQTGLLRRQMRYTAITVIEFSCAAAGILVGIVTAKAGAGYWAIVYKQLTESVTTSAAMWVASGWGVWPPTAPPLGDADDSTDDALPSLVSYGKYTTYSRLVNYFGKNIDVVLLGRFAGATPAGLYEKAEQLGNLAFQQFYFPLVNVTVSSFSRVQDDPERYRFYFRKALIGLFGLTAPLMVFAFVNADVVIRVALGPKWIDAIPIARALTLSVLAGSGIQIARWANSAEGSMKRQFNWSLISTPILIAGVLCGLPWGATGVAWGYTLATAALAYPGLAYSLNHSVLTMQDVARAIWRPVVMATLAGAVLFGVRRIIADPGNVVLQLARDSMIYAVAYACGWIATRGGRNEMIEMLALLRHFRIGKTQVATSGAQ